MHDATVFKGNAVSPSRPALPPANASASRLLVNTGEDTFLQGLGLPQVERLSGLSPREFDERFFRPRVPVVLADAMESWPARTKWTLDYLKEKYGGDEVLATNRYYRGRRMSLAEYVDYVDTVPWELIAGLPREQLLYLRDWVFDDLHPELRDDFSTPPHFASDWIARGLGRFIGQKFCWIYIGPQGAVTPWHQDLMGTHAWLSQLVGRKEWLLTPPDREPQPLAAAIEGGDGETVLAEAARLQARHIVVVPGDIIFVPAHWWHTVTSLESTLSITVNYANASNIRSFAGHWWRLGLRRLKARITLSALPQAK